MLLDLPAGPHRHLLAPTAHGLLVLDAERQPSKVAPRARENFGLALRGGPAAHRPAPVESAPNGGPAPPQRPVDAPACHDYRVMDATTRLGVPSDADASTVRATFARQMRAVHPDIAGPLPRPRHRGRRPHRRPRPSPGPRHAGAGRPEPGRSCSSSAAACRHATDPGLPQNSPDVTFAEPPAADRRGARRVGRRLDSGGTSISSMSDVDRSDGQMGVVGDGSDHVVADSIGHVGQAHDRPGVTGPALTARVTEMAPSSTSSMSTPSAPHRNTARRLWPAGRPVIARHPRGVFGGGGGDEPQRPRSNCRQAPARGFDRMSRRLHDPPGPGHDRRHEPTGDSYVCLRPLPHREPQLGELPEGGLAVHTSRFMRADRGSPPLRPRTRRGAQGQRRRATLPTGRMSPAVQAAGDQVTSKLDTSVVYPAFDCGHAHPEYLGDLIVG